MAASTSPWGRISSWERASLCNRCTTASARTCCSTTTVNVTGCPSSGSGWKRRASPSTWVFERTSMKQRTAILLSCLLLTLLAAVAAVSHAADAPKKALCPVCKVHEGEAEPEPVKATSVYKGETYGFCSEKCKQTFDEYPEAYIPPVLPRPVPAFTVKSLDGKEVPFAALASGKPVLVDFWATW